MLRDIDIAAALAAPGVAAVWTGEDIADLPPIDFRDPAGEALRPYRQPLLAQDRLRYVGEPVAAVFATDPYLAEDAADLVAIEADELPPLLDAEAPPGSFAPGLSTEALVMRAEYGDVDAAFAAAHAIVALDLAIGRHSGVPLETRGALARYDAGARHARAVRRRQGAAPQPRRARPHVRPQHRRGGAQGGQYRRRLRHSRRALSGGCPRLSRGDAARPAGQMDRGPARASDRRQPFARSSAITSAPRSMHEGRILALDDEFCPRPGRLCAHPRRARAGNDDRDAARPVPRAGLSRGRPFPADQQDAGGDLSRAGPLRGHASCASG